MQSPNGNCITDEVTEMPRCCSSRIQSEVAWRVALRPFTVPAIWMAPPNSSSFSVSVVLPASGCEMMAKVRLLFISQVLTSLRFSIISLVCTGSCTCFRSKIAFRQPTKLQFKVLYQQSQHERHAPAHLRPSD